MAHGVEDSGIRSHGAGVAGRRPVPGQALPALQQYNRFLAADPLGNFKETAAMFDAFDIEHDGSGQRVVFEAFQKVLDRQHGLVARSGKPPDADPLLLGKGQKLGSHVSRLGHDRCMAGFRPDRRPRAVKVNMRITDAHGIGSQDEHAGFTGLFYQCLL